MNKDFTVIFEKMDAQAQVEVLEQRAEAGMFSRESLVELDEIAELRRLVAEITEPEPLSFTTA